MEFPSEIKNFLKQLGPLSEELKISIALSYLDLFNIIPSPELRIKLLRLPNPDNFNEIKERYELEGYIDFDILDELNIIRIVELREQSVDVTTICELLYILKVDLDICDVEQEAELLHTSLAITMILLSDIPINNDAIFKDLIKYTIPLYSKHVKAWNARGRVSGI